MIARILNRIITSKLKAFKLETKELPFKTGWPLLDMKYAGHHLSTQPLSRLAIANNSHCAAAVSTDCRRTFFFPLVRRQFRSSRNHGTGLDSSGSIDCCVSRHQHHASLRPGIVKRGSNHFIGLSLGFHSARFLLVPWIDLILLLRALYGSVVWCHSYFLGETSIFSLNAMPVGAVGLSSSPCRVPVLALGNARAKPA